MDAATTNNTAPPVLVWRRPWRIAMALFFFFVVLWAYDVVLTRYWILEAWDLALPGLGDSDLQKHTMRFHMTFGAIALLLSPIQITTPFLEGWRKKNATAAADRAGNPNRYRMLHRITGRIYVVCAILSFVCGQWFIVLKEFRLVGGYNMGAAFSFAGFFIAYFAYMAWKTAPSRNNSNAGGQEYTVEDHRNYAIRSFSQIIAPVLYRYEYLILMIAKIYRTPYAYNDDPSGERPVCDEHNVCDDYLRLFDAVHCWLYWIGAWVVAEIVIAYLPKHRRHPTSSSTAPAAVAVAIPADDTSPLLATSSQQERTNTINDDDDDTGRSSDDTPERCNDNNSRDNENEGNGDKKHRVWVVNFLGCLLAGVTVVGTGPIIIGLTQLLFGNGQGQTEPTTAPTTVDAYYADEAE